jgi:aminoglycoside 3-N-acetyltransferase I
MAYTFRHLSDSDVEVLKQLLKVFGEAFDDVAAYQDRVPSDGYLRSLLSAPYFIALVALNGDDVVGGLAAYVLDKFEQDRREIYIYDLAVSERHRRRGIARGLINELKQVARERRAYVIYVQADKGDDPAIQLYESLGTKEDVYHFDIAVET